MSEPKHSEREARPTNGELLKAYNAWRETQDARLDIEVCTDAHDLLHTGYCGGYLDGLLASRAKPEGVDVERVHKAIWDVLSKNRDHYRQSPRYA